jgi:pentatricopeptide repeat protein
MQGQALVPDVISYSAAIGACGKGDRPQQALELLKHILATDGHERNAAMSACEKDQTPRGSDSTRSTSGSFCFGVDAPPGFEECTTRDF